MVLCSEVFVSQLTSTRMITHIMAHMHSKCGRGDHLVYIYVQPSRTNVDQY